MYQCNRCKFIFDDPGIGSSILSEDYMEKYCVCPACESPEIIEVRRCDICGEACAWGESLCDHCKTVIMQKISITVGDLVIEGFPRKEILDVMTVYLEGQC